MSALRLQADAPPLPLRIADTGAIAEGLQAFRLEWDAISNATYLVQRRAGPLTNPERVLQGTTDETAGALSGRCPCRRLTAERQTTNKTKIDRQPRKTQFI